MGLNGPVKETEKTGNKQRQLLKVPLGQSNRIALAPMSSEVCQSVILCKKCLKYIIQGA